MSRLLRIAARTRQFALRLLGALSLAIGSAVAAVPLLIPVPGGGNGSGPAVLAKSPSATAVRFNSAQVFALAPGAEVELVLPNGVRHVYQYEKTISHGEGMATWIARSPLTGASERAVITQGPSGAWGWMKTAHGDYRIYPGLGHEWLEAREPRNFAPASGETDSPPAPPDPPEAAAVKGVPTIAPVEAKTDIVPKATPTPSFRADVMVLYTRDLATKLGAATMTMILNLIDSANQAYADSEVALTVRLVRAQMIDYPNANDSTLTLNGMAGSGAQAAAFQGITHGAGNVRDAVGADFVALVRDGPTDTGGIAFLLKNPSPYPTVAVPATLALSVNNYCASGCEGIFAHELGHNMGNAHDRATVAKDSNGVVSPTSGVFPHSFGHYNCLNGLDCDPFLLKNCGSRYAGCLNPVADDFGTIMSYLSPRIMKFSNPGVTCTGTGGSARPCGLAGQNDNALGMNTIRQNLAAYRNQTIANHPGSLQFTNVGFAGREAAGIITFEVSRLGGSTGAVAVNYAVAAGTASAGADFTAASGTLNWGSGDTAPKTFVVNIANDGLAEGIETLTATLSAPAGAFGVHLGYPTVASGLLLEPWPTGGVAPTGFTSPSAPPWGLATDSNNGLDVDNVTWKSGAIADFSAGTSVTRFSGIFGAGNVSFAYRVSGYAYPTNALRFSIDGVVVFEAGGGGGWKFAAIPITAGSHTLEWSYEKTLSFPCDLGNPPPPEAASCVDHAWIDQVSLPIAMAASTTTLVSSANPAVTGQSVTLTATVSGSSGVPAGSVDFRDGVATIPGCAAVALGGGSATCTTTALATGSRSLTAVYSGNATYGGSTSGTLLQLVTGAQLLTASPGALAFGAQSINTTSPSAAFTITNPTAAPVTVNAIVAPAGFAVAQNCLGTIAAGQSCSTSATSTPAATGAQAGFIAVEYAGGGPTPVAVSATGERSLVVHYYNSILRRAPDGSGKPFWESEATRMATLGANVNETWYAMATFFYFSPEYLAFGRNSTGFVTDLYNTFFNRAPDAGGLAFWTGQIANGMPREVVLVGFMLSNEFVTFTQGIFGNTAARAEVNVVMDFYRGLLSRLPDTGGFNAWVQQFRTAQCSGAVAVNAQVEAISRAFATSAEYASRNRSNGQYVGDLYNAFLRRGGDLGGVQFWIGELQAGRMSRETVRRQFINSPEFQARVAQIIAQGCFN